jgi:hypothetical protein
MSEGCPGAGHPRAARHFHLWRQRPDQPEAILFIERREGAPQEIHKGDMGNATRLRADGILPERIIRNFGQHFIRLYFSGTHVTAPWIHP